MDATQAHPTSHSLSRPHPLVLVAAAAVTAVSLAGIAALFGWLPGGGTHATPPVEAVKTAEAPAPAVVPAASPSAAPAQAASTPPEKEKVEKAASAKPAEHRAPRRVTHSTNPTATAETKAAGAVPPAPTIEASAPPICRDCGVVEAVNEVAVEGKGSGGGAVAGGLVGGILGNQVGKGNTRSVATVLGAVGGAYAGNQIEKSSKKSKRYDVVVRFEDGTTRTFSSNSRPDWQGGAHVRVQNGALVPN